MKKADAPPRTAPSRIRCQTWAVPVRRSAAAASCAAEQVRRDHDEVPWQAVRPDPSGEQEDEVRQHVGRKHEAEIRGGAGQDDHREGERDRRERAAEQRDRAPEEEQAKVALGKRTERDPAERRSQPQDGGHRPVLDCERFA
jgi:hypothetical protein